MKSKKKFNVNKEKWPVSTPAGISQDRTVVVQPFSVSEDDARTYNKGKLEYSKITPGDYMRLLINGKTMMSNTPMEIRTNFDFYLNAKGHVLINGLGLGCLVEKLLTRTDIKSITVIENNPSVIELVAPTFNANPKVNIIEADAFSWIPPQNAFYDAVWHDIWIDISTGNLEQMKALMKKYSRICAYQDCWGRKEAINNSQKHSKMVNDILGVRKLPIKLVYPE